MCDGDASGSRAVAKRAGDAMGARLRLGIFAGVLVSLALAEALAPARARVLPRRERWSGTAPLAFLAGVVGLFTPPAGLVGAARWAKHRRIGLFNRVHAPAWFAWAASLALLDGWVWAQHVFSHRAPWFWRLHRVHHTDPDLDVTTGVRFHPVEIAVSGLWKAALVVFLGVPAGAVLAFEAWLSTGALFSHANLRLPTALDGALRWIIVTPDSHRLHHRTGERESDVNFGFGLSLWDRLFGTFAAGQVAPETPLGVGEGWRGARDQRPVALLLQPFQGEPA